MMKECNYYYYKSKGRYYGFIIETEEIKYVDKILDLIIELGVDFVSREEFEENVLNPITANVKDLETGTVKIGEIIFER